MYGKFGETQHNDIEDIKYLLWATAYYDFLVFRVNIKCFLGSVGLHLDLKSLAMCASASLTS
jgi:hypothetical protein